jgi:hypothetical protein
MTEQRATPTPLIGLRLLRGDTAAPGTGVADTDTAPGTKGDTRATQEPVSVSGAGGGTAPVPLPGTEVVPLTPAERTRLTVTHWAGTAANGAGQLWLHPGRVGHALYHGKPDSMAERRVYVKSRAWVPPELKDDLSGKLIAAEGIAFHWVAGLIQALLLILYAALDRQLRLAGLIAGILVFVLVVLPHIPHP